MKSQTVKTIGGVMSAVALISGGAGVAQAATIEPAAAAPASATTLAAADAADTEACLLYTSHCDTFTLDLIGRTLSWRKGYERWYTLMERQRLLFANSSQSKFSDEGAAAVAENRIAAFRETFENRELAFTDEYCYYAWMCASVDVYKRQVLGGEALREGALVARNLFPAGQHLVVNHVFQRTGAKMCIRDRQP